MWETGNCTWAEDAQASRSPTRPTTIGKAPKLRPSTVQRQQQDTVPRNKREAAILPENTPSPELRNSIPITNTPITQRYKELSTATFLLHTYVQPHITPDGKSADLLTRIRIKQSLQYPSVREIKASFYQKPSHRPSDAQRVGYLTGYTISRTEEGSNWIQDLLTPQVEGLEGDERPMTHYSESEDGSEVDELCMMMQNIYHKSGAAAGSPRDEMSAHAEELTQDEMHFISEFMLVSRFRGGSGMAQICLQTYLSLLPRFGNGQAYRGSVALSPAGFQHVMEQKARQAKRDPETGEKMGLATWSEVEKKLIKSYRKSGFEVWCESDPALAEMGGGVTIMGRKGWREGEKVGVDKTVRGGQEAVERRRRFGIGKRPRIVKKVTKPLRLDDD